MAAGFSISPDLPRNGAHTARLVGELDLSGAAEVDRRLAHLEGVVRLDCTELRFMDCAGLRCLLAVAARLDRLVLVNVAPQVRRVFEITDTTSLLHLERSAVAGHSRTQGGA